MGCIYRHVGNWYYLQGIHVFVVSAYKWSWLLHRSCDTVSIKNSTEGRYAIRGSSSYNWRWVDRLPLCWRTMSRIRACVSPTTYKIRKKWIFKENSSFFWLRQKIEWGFLPALYSTGRRELLFFNGKQVRDILISRFIQFFWLIKGTGPRDFYPQFFSLYLPIWVPDWQVQLWLRFRRDVRIES